LHKHKTELSEKVTQKRSGGNRTRVKKGASERTLIKQTRRQGEGTAMKYGGGEEPSGKRFTSPNWVQEEKSHFKKRSSERRGIQPTKT